MAKKANDSVLVKAAERVGRTAGKAARALDKVTAAAAELAGRKKAVKKVAKKAAKKAKPTSTKTSRKLATDAALKTQHGALVDERAHARTTSGQRWAARKPR